MTADPCASRMSGLGRRTQCVLSTGSISLPRAAIPNTSSRQHKQQTHLASPGWLTLSAAAVMALLVQICLRATPRFGVQPE